MNVRLITVYLRHLRMALLPWTDIELSQMPLPPLNMVKKESKL